MQNAWETDASKIRKEVDVLREELSAVAGLQEEQQVQLSAVAAAATVVANSAEQTVAVADGGSGQNRSQSRPCPCPALLQFLCVAFAVCLPMCFQLLCRALYPALPCPALQSPLSYTTSTK